MGRFRVSVQNLLEPLTPNFIPAPLTGYPASNLSYPQRQLAVWKSASLVQWSVVWDLLTVPVAPFGVLFVAVNVNVAAMNIAGNTVNNWASPPFVRNTVIFEDPITGRRSYGLWFRTWPYRYLLQSIDVQTPTDGQPVYQCGGFWFGPCLDVPNGLLGLPMTLGPRKPRQFDDAQSGAFEEYADLGPPRVELTMTRRGVTNRGLPGLTDDLSRWLAVDRQWGGIPAAVLLNSDSSRYAYIMRNVTDLGWARDSAYAAKNQVKFIETYGP